VDTGTPVERYLAHLDSLSGGLEPQFWPVGEGPGRVTAIGYRDVPEPGMLLGLTYGLSRGRWPEWTHGRPELSICVRSADPTWALAIAHLAATLPAQGCRFGYGDTIDFGEPVTGEGAMDGFVVFAPIAVPAQDASVQVDDGPPVVITGVYPTHASERAFIAERGLEAFWQLDWDPYDVTRGAVA
jgi:hypothetical protein